MKNEEVRGLQCEDTLKAIFPLNAVELGQDQVKMWNN